MDRTEARAAALNMALLAYDIHRTENKDPAAAAPKYAGWCDVKATADSFLNYILETE